MMIPTKFGFAQIHIAHVLSHEIGVEIQRNDLTGKITVLHTSDLPASILYKTLYQCPEAQAYDSWGCYPFIEKNRTEQGNLEIDFLGRKPSRYTLGQLSEESEKVETRLDFTAIIGFDMAVALRKRQIQAVRVKQKPITENQIQGMERAIATSLVHTIKEFFGEHKLMKGVWSPKDYSKYLMDKFEVEMDPSFFTGFANPDYFKKTAPFTFKLQERKKASEAILSFLHGPTVANSTNVVTVCYYKCILDILGEGKFDDLFRQGFGLSHTLDQNGITDGFSPISLLSEIKKSSIENKEGVLGKRPLQIGQSCCFGGVDYYLTKHPAGLRARLTVIYIGDNEQAEQLFFTPGFQKPLTEKEINQKFIELYNEERTAEDEKFIANVNHIPSYHIEKNQNLRKYYTISEAIDPTHLVRGYIVDSVKGLNPKRLITLENGQRGRELLDTFLGLPRLSFV